MSTENVVKSVLHVEEPTTIVGEGFQLIPVDKKGINEKKDWWVMEILPVLKGNKVTVSDVYHSIISCYGEDRISRMRVYKKMREWKAVGVCRDDNDTGVYEF